MNLRITLAFVLSILILWGWQQIVVKKFFPQQQTPTAQNITQTTTTAISTATIHQITYPTKDSTTPKKEEEITWNIENINITFSPYGGSIRKYSFTQKNKNIEIISPGYAFFSPHNLSLKTNTPNKEITFVAEEKTYRIEKTYKYDNKKFELNMNIKIKAPETKEIANFPIFAINAHLIGDCKMQDLMPYYVSLYSGKEKSYIKLKPTNKNIQYENKSYDWLSINNRYYHITLFPKLPENTPTAFTLTEKDKIPCLEFYTNVKGTDSITISLYFTAGTKLYKTLKAYNCKLEKIVDFGTFGFIGKPMFHMLNYIHRITRNYGVAIIILTIILQLFILPLTYKNVLTTVKMKQLQPKLEEIRIKFKNDPKRLQMELMEIYKKYKVNPASGCLTLLLQIPFFWALFTMLRNIYELKGEKFILWIKDLSTYDPYYILPMLMGIFMFLQQKLSSGNIEDPSQRFMVYFMPIFFVIIFLKFPAGLVLYWLVSSLFSFLIQLILTKKISMEKT
jgi:YidC/Oxa1 family membrane protein insertase